MRIKVLVDEAVENDESDEADNDVVCDEAGLIVEAGTLTVGERGSGSCRAYFWVHRALRLLKVTSVENCKRLDRWQR